VYIRDRCSTGRRGVNFEDTTGNNDSLNTFTARAKEIINQIFLKLSFIYSERTGRSADSPKNGKTCRMKRKNLPETERSGGREMSEPVYIKHPLIRENTVEQRLYQIGIASNSLTKNTLVVLPTSLGKTVVALLVMAARLEKAGGKIVMTAPTKPLVEQHYSFFSDVLTLDPSGIVSFSGDVKPELRQEIWKQATVIIATPQVIENDLLQKRISLEDVTCMIFDEAHRTTGNYAYTYIAEKYNETAEKPLVLAITASPGSSSEKIEEVCRALSIRNVIVKTEDDPDVRPYVHKKEIEWMLLELPEPLKNIRNNLQRISDDCIRWLTDAGYPPQSKYISRTEMLTLQKHLVNEIRTGFADPTAYTALSAVAELMKIDHAVTMIETQGPAPLAAYLEKLDKEASSSGASRASKRLADDLYFRQTYLMALECETEHPKFKAVRQIVRDQLAEAPGSKIIVFTNFRDTANVVADALSDTEGVSPVRFVGQSSRKNDKGLSRKKQAEIIERFRDGEFNVLVATSVAEEGLDIPSTDLVLFFEPVPSEIRSIQRKGRTGRFRTGRVIVLVTRGTRDEAYYWSSRSKERRMLSIMKDLENGYPDDEETDGYAFGGNGSPGRPGRTADLSSFMSPDDEEIPDRPGNSDPETEEITDPETKGKTNAGTEGNADPETEGKTNAGPEEITDVGSERKTDEEKAGRQDESGLPESSKNDVVLKVIADSREMRSGVPERLEKAGVCVDVRTMEVGDYVLSDDTAVERKTSEDFAASLLDGKRNIFDQLLHLTKNYKKPILILEGEEDPSSVRNISPASVSGALLSITMDLHVSVIRTRSVEETAEILRMIASKEQIDERKSVNPHGKKTARTTAEQQEYMLSSIPGVGPYAAHLLLEHFGSLKAVLNASEAELMTVRGIGKKTAERIRSLVAADYTG